ncbi:MAG TPA: Hsp20/alpha crystallin family protein [Candidatus Polarisedimenticolaceae bacterium]|nr:Hsp20/alpha crystallin family protein [Candidatus Polarisedimenticolaceae bacterium]
MAIQRWDPLRDLSQLQQKMNRMFDEALSRSAGPEAADAELGGWRPPLDLCEEPERFVLRVDLPGVSASDVEIQVQNGLLSLRGERRLEGGLPRESYLRIERPHGRFTVQLALPPSVDGGGIQAEQRGGVLEIVLPKRGAEVPSRIPLRSA